MFNKKVSTKILIQCILIIIFSQLYGTSFAITITNWEFVPHGGAEHQFMDIAIDPIDSNIIYLSTSTGVYKSENKGLNWKKIFDGFIREIVVDPNNTKILYAGPNDEYWRPGIYKSIDGGKTWSVYTDGLTDSDLASLDIAIDDSHVLVLGNF